MPWLSVVFMVVIFLSLALPLDASSCGLNDANANDSMKFLRMILQPKPYTRCMRITRIGVDGIDVCQYAFSIQEWVIKSQ